MCRCCPKWKTYSIPNPNSSSSPDGQQMPSFACIVRRRPNPKGSGKGGSRKKVKSGGRQIGTIRVVAVRVGVEFVTGLWISQTRTGDRGYRGHEGTHFAWTHFWAGFSCLFLCSPWPQWQTYLFARLSLSRLLGSLCVPCVCLCVCVLATQCKLLPDAGQTRPGSVSHGELLRVARWCFWSCPCPLDFERHSFKVP